MERWGRSITADNCSSNNNKGKGPWMSYNQIGRAGPLSSGMMGGFSWPPRSYSCSFCKREFKSAQALGGHMNVHRRDKARLRQSPPLGPPVFDFNPNPSLGSKPVPFGRPPIPNLNMPPPPSCSSADKISLVTNTLTSMTSPLTHFSCSSPLASRGGDDLKTMERVMDLFGTGGLKDIMEKDMGNDLQQVRKVVRLDLEIGICGDDYKDDLDLELRL